MHHDRVAERVAPLITAGLVATCAPLDFEALFSARGSHDYEQTLLATWVSGVADTVEHVETTTLRYNYRLRPGAAAVAALTAEWHRSRWIWNQCVQARKDRLPWINDMDLTAARSRIRVVANHQNIAVEDFKPRFLAKSTMARKSADAAIGATKQELVEYARRVGERWYSSHPHTRR